MLTRKMGLSEDFFLDPSLCLAYFIAVEWDMLLDLACQRLVYPLHFLLVGGAPLADIEMHL